MFDLILVKVQWIQLDQQRIYNKKYFLHFAFLAAIKIAVAVHFWINEKEKVRANKHAESYDTHIAS